MIALHRSLAGSRAGRSAGPCRRQQGQAQPARPQAVLSPTSEAAECCQTAPTCSGSRRADVCLPSSAAAAWPRPSYVACSSGSSSSPDSVLMASALSLSRTNARCAAIGPFQRPAPGKYFGRIER